MSKTILITGASRGIGKAIALELAKEDINIVINCAHDMDNLTMLRDELLSKGACCEMYKADVSNFDEVYRMFDFTLQKFGKIDVLINNAGIASIGLFQHTTPEMWNNILGCNLNSVYNCCHFAVNDMLKRHEGKIINISSVWGLYGASCETAYSASKGGINAFTKALAKELAPSNIQVNAIACGAIDTSMNHHLNDEEINELKEEIPAGHLGAPAGVAKLVSLILSSDDYLTGQIIQYDGGWI
ncbi:MAG: SDR family NAD(P)-dependent oxidoreductase [Eubacteriales bacterium]|nr:SDR family NAD(P)-dependent oxidoreductase [Eubacteriales bacterium]